MQDKVTAGGERLVYSADICADYGVTLRALRKWIQLGRFPHPDMNLHGRNAWFERTTRAHKAAVMAGRYSQRRRPGTSTQAA